MARHPRLDMAGGGTWEERVRRLNSIIPIHSQDARDLWSPRSVRRSTVSFALYNEVLSALPGRGSSAEDVTLGLGRRYTVTSALATPAEQSAPALGFYLPHLLLGLRTITAVSAPRRRH